MKENVLKGVFVAAIAGAAAYFRELILPVMVLAVVMSVDYISGMVSAWIMGELSSRVGVMGIVKKVAYLLAVVVAIVADRIVQTAAGKIGVDFGGFYFFGLLVTIWLILNECISILWFNFSTIIRTLLKSACVWTTTMLGWWEWSGWKERYRRTKSYPGR